MRTVRQYGPAWIAGELLAWILFPVGLLWMLYDRAARWAGSTPRQRVERMIRWYPPEWRALHGEAFGALLEDAIEAGEDGPRLWLDVAREAAAVRLQALVHARWLIVASVLWTVGVVLVLPLTLVPLALGNDAVAESAGAVIATVVVGLVLMAIAGRVFLGGRAPLRH